MANMVSRRVTFIKVKKGQIRKKPVMHLGEGKPREEGEESTAELAPIERPAPPPRPLWKMALIPILVLGLVGAAFTLAMNMGDNIRKSNVIDVRADREDFDVRADQKRTQLPSYEDRVSSADLEGRKSATDKSFLDTHYAGVAGATTGGSATGNGGVPQTAKGKTASAQSAQEKLAVNCVVNSGSSAALAQGLGDCLSKQK